MNALFVGSAANVRDKTSASAENIPPRKEELANININNVFKST